MSEASSTDSGTLTFLPSGRSLTLEPSRVAISFLPAEAPAAIQLSLDARPEAPGQPGPDLPWAQHTAHAGAAGPLTVGRRAFWFTLHLRPNACSSGFARRLDGVRHLVT